MATLGLGMLASILAVPVIGLLGKTVKLLRPLSVFGGSELFRDNVLNVAYAGLAFSITTIVVACIAGTLLRLCSQRGRRVNAVPGAIMAVFGFAVLAFTVKLLNRMTVDGPITSVIDETAGKFQFVGNAILISACLEGVMAGLWTLVSILDYFGLYTHCVGYLVIGCIEAGGHY